MVVHDRLDVSPVLGVRDEHEGQKIPSLRGDMVGEREWRIHDILVEQVDTPQLQSARTPSSEDVRLASEGNLLRVR